MPPQWLALYRGCLLVAAVLGSAVGYLALRYRAKRGATPLLVLAGGGLCYVGVKLAVSVVRGTPLVFVVSRFTVPATGIATAGFVVLVVEYTGIEYPVSRRTIGLLAIEPVLATGLIWLDIRTFWVPLGADTTTLSGYAWELTGLAIANQLYMSLLLLGALALLVRFGRHSAGPFPTQAGALVAAGLCPLLGNAAYYLGYVPVNLTPVAFILSALILAYATLWNGFLDLVPIGRTEVLDDLTVGVFTVDTDHRLVDINEYGRRLFGFESDAVVVGRHIDAVFAEYPAVRDIYWASNDDSDDSAAELAVNGQHHTVEVTPLRTPGGTLIGHSVAIHEITERWHREKRLRALQTTAQQLSDATSTVEVGEIAVEAAVEVLGLDMTGMWAYEEATQALVPVTQTTPADEELGDQPTFSLADSFAGQAFQAGEMRIFNQEASPAEVHNPDTAITSEIVLPLGDFGVLITRSTSRQRFSEMETDLFQILGAHVEAALGRVEREQNLQEQNERLERFASIVSHDLRNPLMVTMARLDLVAEQLPDEHADTMEANLARMDTMIDDLLRMARAGVTVDDPESVEVTSIATEAWQHLETAESTLALAFDSDPTVQADRERLLHVFENLFRNAVEHNDDPVTVRVGPLAAGEQGSTDPSISGVYIEDDGAGIPDSERDAIFDQGYSTSDDGTGFGLSIVEDIVQAHGWQIRVTDGSLGGARFELTGVEAAESPDAVSSNTEPEP